VTCKKFAVDHSIVSHCSSYFCKSGIRISVIQCAGEHQKQPITHLWLLAAAFQKITAQLVEKLLMKSPFQQLPFSTKICTRRPDILQNIAE
jgi:hypothetical protein